MTVSVVMGLLVAAAAVALWSPAAARRLGNARWPSLLLASGHAFLPLGVGVGLLLSETPAASGQLMADLWPLVAFVAGWVGYEVGIHGNLRRLRSQRLPELVGTILPSILAAALTGGLALGVLLGLKVGLAAAIPLALIAAAAGACSGAMLLETIAERRRRRGGDDRFARLARAAHADDVVVCLCAILAFASLAPFPGMPSTALALVLPLGCGVLLGFVAWMLLGSDPAPDEGLLLSIAMLSVGAGVGVWLEVSPAVVCAVLAVTLATLPGERASALRGPIKKMGRPANVILLFATGIAVAPHLSWWMVVGAVGIVGTRALAFHLAGRLQRATLGPDARLLAAPGRLGIVVAFTFYHLVGGELAADVLGAIALAAFVDQLYVARLMMRVAELEAEDLTGGPPQSPPGALAGEGAR